MLEEVEYDDVIRLETFQHDMKPLVHYAGLTLADILRENITTNSNRVENVHEIQKQTFVVPKLLKEFSKNSAEVIDNLKAMYVNYFKLFGYAFDTASLQASCAIRTESGDYCC